MFQDVPVQKGIGTGPGSGFFLVKDSVAIGLVHFQGPGPAVLDCLLKNICCVPVPQGKQGLVSGFSQGFKIDLYIGCFFQALADDVHAVL